MIIWGFGKVTKKIIGNVMKRDCAYCNTESIWQLCIVRTWFTLFFIPLIPYSNKKCLICPNCGSYIQLTNEEFESIKNEIDSSNVSDAYKYAGKTETQINYLKCMEEERAKENS